MKSVTLNGLDLQDGAFRCANTDAFSPAKKDITRVELARADGAVNVFERLKDKPINLAGTISADSSDELEGYIDQLTSFYNQKNLALKIGYRGGIRYWNVNCDSLVITRRGTDVSRCAFAFLFNAQKPYATDTTSAVFLNATGKTTDFTSSIDAQGSYLCYPEFTITVNSIDPDTTDSELVFGNPAADRYLTITETLQAGDVITIDTVYQQCYLNSVEIYPSGQFPTWAPGSGVFDFSSNTSSIDIDIYADYDLRWL